MNETLIKKILKELMSTLLYAAVVVFCVFLFITFVMQRTDVSGSSMFPTLHDKDVLMVEKVSYRFKHADRFDIIIFPYRYGNDEFFIKRVIGLPGETVRIDTDGNIYINEVKLEDPYGAEVIQDPGRAVDSITLGDDEYFVMGDNRNHSMDSRDPSVGNIKISDVMGRAFVRIYPFSDFGGID